MTKPTVGREVHFYSDKTYWHRNQALSPYSGPEHDVGFTGPFAAKVVFVHLGPTAEDGGEVNLLICFPSMCHGSAEKTEIVEHVMGSAEPKVGCWTWPPRS